MEICQNVNYNSDVGLGGCMGGDRGIVFLDFCTFQIVLNKQLALLFYFIFRTFHLDHEHFQTDTESRETTNPHAPNTHLQ